MERLQRDMEKSKGKTVVLSTGLKDKNPASDMMEDADEEEEEDSLEDFKISEDEDDDDGEDEEVDHFGF